jgi:hypothetical protein
VRIFRFRGILSPFYRSQKARKKEAQGLKICFEGGRLRWVQVRISMIRGILSPFYQPNWIRKFYLGLRGLK